jgi:DNA-binding SARP family transcriptional activator/tetratricopeptide (TPR) repeat protein
LTSKSFRPRLSPHYHLDVVIFRATEGDRAAMRFALLGPVQVHGEDGPLEVRGAVRRTLLAALLMHADTVVSADRLSEYLWGENQPSSATSSLYNQIMRLRLIFGDGGERIRAISPGYLIQVEPGELDLHLFTEHCGAGRRALVGGQWASAADAYAAALALWRGQPLADVPNLSDHPLIRQLDETRLQAVQGRIEADLNLARHKDLIGELRALTESYPLREAFREQLMLALYRSGRQAEALEAYLAQRQALVEELGVEPSAALRDLHARILDSDPALDIPAPRTEAGPAAGRAAHAARTAPPRQLPADTRVFTGRGRELGELLALAGKAPAGNAAGMVVISALDGMAGVGKSALAVHAAHHVSESFPDGQLFVDLRGHTGGLEPLRPQEALHQLLRSLDVPPQQIPESLDARAAIYRSRLSGTRTLIVLDNAAGSAQVRPLLPAEKGCFVLITSRTVLSGLDDAHLVSLDVLPEPDAVELLVKTAGPGRVRPQDPAVAELVALCGRVPLAIRIVGARLRHRRTLSVQALVARLRDDSSRLGHLRDEDRSLTALFDASYASLYEDEQRMFRSLGLISGPDTDTYAAAHLLGTDPRSAERLLESLLDRNLLLQSTPARYRLHNLLRDYARTRAEDDTAAARGAAAERLLDYYQYAAYLAAGRMTGAPRPGPQPGRPARDPLPDLPDRLSALAWLRTERANLTAARAGTDDPDRLIALASSLAPLLHHDGPWAEAEALHRDAADLAGRSGRPAQEAHALMDIGRILNVSGQLSSAVDLYERALAGYLRIGDVRGQANARYEIGRIKHVNGDSAAAAGLLEQALADYRRTGDEQGEVNALRELGRVRQVSGQEQAAFGLLQEALPLYRRLGDNLGEANTLIDLAYALVVDGGFAAATDHARQALELYRIQGSRHGEANALGLLGQNLLATGDWSGATGAFDRALAIHREIGFRQGEGIALWGLGRVRLEAGEFSSASDHFEQSLKIFQDSGYLLAEAEALHGLGRVHHAEGRYRAAAEALDKARAIFQDNGDRPSQGDVLSSIGALTLDTTGPAEALAHYREALRLAREAHSPANEARALEGAAHCRDALGEREAARTGLAEALALYQRLGSAGAGRAAAYLRTLSSS